MSTATRTASSRPASRPSPGVTLTLTGHHDSGTPVNVTTVTDAGGQLRVPRAWLPSDAAGYTITETQPRYVRRCAGDRRPDRRQRQSARSATDRITGIVYPGGCQRRAELQLRRERRIACRPGLQRRQPQRRAGAGRPADRRRHGHAHGHRRRRAACHAHRGDRARRPLSNFADLADCRTPRGYTVTETQPAAYDSVGENAGTAGRHRAGPNQIKVSFTAANPNMHRLRLLREDNQPAVAHRHRVARPEPRPRRESADGRCSPAGRPSCWAARTAQRPARKRPLPVV